MLKKWGKRESQVKYLSESQVKWRKEIFNKDPQVEEPAKNAQDSNLRKNWLTTYKPSCKSTVGPGALLLSVAVISTFYLL